MRGVLETERHAKELEKSKRCDHCSFGYVLWVNRYLVETSDQIDLAEDVSSGEVGREVMDAWYRVAVLL